MLSKIKHLLSVSIQYLTDIQEKAHKNHLRTKNIQQKLSIDNLVYSHMLCIVSELYEVFKSNTYSRLALIQHPSAIRIVNYSIVDNNYCYIFNVTKKVDGHTPDIILKDIQDNMNRDIAFTQQNILHFFGYEYLCCNYPLLASGIYILSVKDISPSQIQIMVQTHLLPQ